MSAQYLFVHLRLAEHLWDVVETDVHGGDAADRHRQQLTRVALATTQQADVLRVECKLKL